MELENMLSPKNQTFGYVIKEFDNDRLYLEKLPRLRLHSTQYAKGNICEQKQINGPEANRNGPGLAPIFHGKNIWRKS